MWDSADQHEKQDLNLGPRSRLPHRCDNFRYSKFILTVGGGG
eukprot:SAG11_NODE_5520_length_1537_cov_0.985396_1_plen_41_part_10